MEVSTKHAPLVSLVWALSMSFIVHSDLCQGVGGTGQTVPWKPSLYERPGLKHGEVST